MKAQLILLGLLLTSAFAQYKPTDSVTVGSVTYSVGKDSNNCGVQRVEGSTTRTHMFTTGLTSSDACVPESIVSIGSQIYVVTQIKANAPILTNPNSQSGTGSEYHTLVPFGSIVDGTLVITRIVTTNSDSAFGRFSYGTYIAAKNAANNWGSFDVDSVTSCAAIVQVRGDTQSGYSLTDENGNRITDATGNGVYMVFDTSDQTFTGATENNKACSALIFSAVSALLAFIVAL